MCVCVYLGVCMHGYVCVCVCISACVCMYVSDSRLYYDGSVASVHHSIKPDVYSCSSVRSRDAADGVSVPVSCTQCQ